MTLDMYFNDALVFVRSNMEYNQRDANIMGPKEFVRSYGTIHLNLGRQTGKSTLIRRYLAANPGSIVIVAVERAKQYYMEHGTPENQIYVASDLDFYVRELSHIPEYIFVDEPSLCNRSGTRIHRELWNQVNDPRQIVVFLGE
jgi:hypothetical protein